ncbi:thioredoxin family protein [Mariniblastus fucicola]|uniref:Thioredoxin-1 n=1 Tax=Mariniblastus fucicola TaxID=980251 RepID=A0A5B9PHG0_9BACT|nr:thioredoxin domain-containing protein [Mariniblastus fucicola]QEG25049.1 Thioredoxin-1 [Mariniblastus fucicola]
MAKVISISRNRFAPEVLDSEIPVVVELRKGCCAPCEKLEAIVERLADEFKGQIKFVKVNVSEESSLADYFDPHQLPALALVDHSKDEGFYLGELQESEIRERLQKWIAVVGVRQNSNT